MIHGIRDFALQSAEKFIPPARLAISPKFEEPLDLLGSRSVCGPTQARFLDLPLSLKELPRSFHQHDPLRP